MVRGFASLLVIVLCAVPAFAQGDRGQITGFVKDQTGAVIPGATVTATRTQTNLPRVTVTDAQGYYVLPALPPGVTALLAQQVAVQDRAVEAALHGDRQVALQALLLDPVVQSYDAAVQILDELLEAQAPYLPQFVREDH